MRMSEKCPKCGHSETVNWLPSTWDVEKDIAPADSFPNGLPENDQFVYRYSKDKQYVIRLLRTVFEARGNKWSINKREQWDSNKQVKRKESKCN